MSVHEGRSQGSLLAPLPDDCSQMLPTHDLQEHEFRPKTTAARSALSSKPTLVLFGKPLHLKTGRDLRNLILHRRTPVLKDFPKVAHLTAGDGHCFGLNTTETTEALCKKESLRKKSTWLFMCFTV